MQIKSKLNIIINKALESANLESSKIGVVEATKPQFGDYQFNGIMKIAKALKRNPRDLANRVLENIDKSDIIDRVEVAGAGFINIWLSNSWIERSILAIVDDERLGIEKVQNPQTIVVDYSSPNMAKQMHVGHLRSTIIGDTLVRLFEFLGHKVIKQNHIGDWGTQFGMLIAYLEEIGEDGNATLSDLEEFYKSAKKRFDEDEKFANRAREYVVKLQSGDERSLELWKRFIDSSLKHCEVVYDKLGVKLIKDDVRAESFYNERLKDIVNYLENSGHLVESNGAKCVFVDGFDNPLIIQKSDGGFLYATTDLAALEFRAKELKANRVCYVVDARQSDHFKQVFSVAKSSGLVPKDMSLEHIAFGTMMDKSGRPFKTRDGRTIKLIDLLDEAINRAKETIKNRDISDRDLERVAKAIGIGAVKYADLSVNRESNYIFSWDKMLSFDGNTALYIQYAYARIMSIFRRYSGDIKSNKIKITNELERSLAIMLLRFEDTLIKASNDATPNTITSYLYNLVTIFMKFYEQNPILKEDIPEDIKESRLLLAKVTARTIEIALNILGIEVVDRI
jgi:arginyl-tRNA synthetase